jgi:FHA domain
MSARCPDGHLSLDPDYCDQCGIRITSGSEQYAYQGESGGAYRSRGGDDGYGRPAPAAGAPSGARGGYDPVSTRRGPEPGRAPAAEPYRDDRRGGPAPDDRQRGYGAPGRGGPTAANDRYAPAPDGQYDDRYANGGPAGGGRDRYGDYDDRYGPAGGADAAGGPGGERWAGEGRYANPSAPAGGGRWADDGYGGAAPAAGAPPERDRWAGAEEAYYDDRTATPGERGYSGGGGGRGGYGAEPGRADPLGLERAGTGGGRSPAAAPAYGTTCPRCRAPQDGGSLYCQTCGFDLAADGGRGADPRGTDVGWDAVVEAEREYYDSGDDHRVPFPTTYQRRLFPLTGQRLLIGRRSESRNIHPEIDLSGAPEDPGVSRSHAMLEKLRDGSYAVIDPGSTNGTRINDEPNPIPPNQPIPLADGDRVYVGAWTRITVRMR